MPRKNLLNKCRFFLPLTNQPLFKYQNNYYNIYNFKLYRIVYKLKAKISVHDRKLFKIVNNLKVRKGKSSITKEKTIRNLGLKL